LNKRTVFFVSDQTGVTAETMGHSLLTQFDGAQYQSLTLPFIATTAQATAVVQRIDAAGRESGLRPIVFATLVDDAVRDVLQQANALVLDFFAAFLGPLEAELAMPSAHASGRAHGMADLAAYSARINATNFALANDDGAGARDYAAADVVLVGVSRSGKTPTCLYLALQYGVYAANYPLADEDLESGELPAVLLPHRHKLFGLTIRPDRLQQIRHERRPGSRYASLQQVQSELRAALALYARTNLPFLDTTECSIEEIASRILDRMRLARRERRERP
jgi:regulator of PEP synthase PpsR (kinase-PPPase family)